VTPEKFFSFYQGLATKHDPELLQELMGVTEEDVWKKMLAEAKINIKGALGNVGDAATKKKLLDQFDKQAANAKTLEDLGNIVQKLLKDVGSSLEYGYAIFSYGGKQHIFIQLKTKQQFELLHDRFASYKEMGLQVGSVLVNLLSGYIPDPTMIDSEEGGES
jgi:hypothetical protein